MAKAVLCNRRVMNNKGKNAAEYTMTTQGRRSESFRVLAVQKKTWPTLKENMEAVREMLRGVPMQAPDFILLPEIFTCPYDNSCFPRFAQSEGGEVYRFLSDLARARKCYLIGGSVPELDDAGRIFNTSFIFGRNGELLGKHRKVHLFDIDVPGGQYFRESDVLSPGEQITVFDTEYGKMGVCICFDIRFPEMFLKMRKMGVNMVFVPAAFNMTTGPAHWNILFRSRALDQQIYVLGCSPARDESADYVAYGHSILTDPWGNVVRELDEKEGLLSAEIPLSRIQSIRDQIPLAQGDRAVDLYSR